MPGIQEWIHTLEEGKGATWIKRLLFFLGVLALGVWYDLREYKSFSSPEMMDVAQLARNISQGEGFTTDFIRPFSIALLQRHKGEINVVTNAHPDLANAPVYPYLLAGVLKVVPLSYRMEPEDDRFQPEVAITVFNQILFIGVVIATFILARRLFDDAVAWLTAALLIGNALLWEYSNSGLPSMLMILLLMLIANCLFVMEARSREEVIGSQKGLLGLAAVVGLLLGIGCLTRYSFGFLIIPVGLFLATVLKTRRGPVLMIIVAIFAAVITPWIARNISVSGTPFGVAGYAIFENTPQYPKNRLERAMPKDFDMDMKAFNLRDYVRKLVEGTSKTVNLGMENLSGSWVGALFIAALLIRFNNIGLQRLKWFIAGAGLVLIVVQALARTELLESGLSSENLLLLLTPLLLMFGAAMFFVFLDQMELPGPQWRRFIITTFLAVGCASLILRLLPPRSFTIAWPPYNPAAIKFISGWMKEKELMMSDMPWAVAWYGERKCVLPTLDTGDQTPSDFFYINDYQKEIQGLYLSPLTLDGRFATEMLKGQDSAWGRFVLEALLRTNVPPGFPLKQSPRGMLPEHLFLSDRNRWGK